MVHTNTPGGSTTSVDSGRKLSFSLQPQLEWTPTLQLMLVLNYECFFANSNTNTVVIAELLQLPYNQQLYFSVYYVFILENDKLHNGYRLCNQANSALHPLGVDKLVVGCN